MFRHKEPTDDRSGRKEALQIIGVSLFLLVLVAGFLYRLKYGPIGRHHQNIVSLGAKIFPPMFIHSYYLDHNSVSIGYIENIFSSSDVFLYFTFSKSGLRSERRDKQLMSNDDGQNSGTYSNGSGYAPEFRQYVLWLNERCEFKRSLNNIPPPDQRRDFLSVQTESNKSQIFDLDRNEFIAASGLLSDGNMAFLVSSFVRDSSYMQGYPLWNGDRFQESLTEDWHLWKLSKTGRHLRRMPLPVKEPFMALRNVGRRLLLFVLASCNENRRSSFTEVQVDVFTWLVYELQEDFELRPVLLQGQSEHHAIPLGLFPRVWGSNLVFAVPLGPRDARTALARVSIGEESGSAARYERFEFPGSGNIQVCAAATDGSVLAYVRTVSIPEPIWQISRLVGNLTGNPIGERSPMDCYHEYLWMIPSEETTNAKTSEVSPQ